MKLFSLKYIPLTIVIAFNFFTIFIFFTAPIVWQTDNLLLFFAFSFLCQIMITIGYTKGANKSQKKIVSKKLFYKLSKEKFNFIFGFYLFTFLIKYAYLLRYQLLDVKGMINVLLVGIADPHFGYHLALDASRPYTISWSLYFLIAIIDQVFFIICFLKWRDMNRFSKYIFIFLLFVEIFYWMGRGTNFGLITLITTFLFSLMFMLKSTKLNFKKLLLYFVLSLLLFIGSISIFSSTLNNRRGNTYLDYSQFDLGNSKVNENSIAFSFVPKPLHDTYMYVVSYLAQGYYHTCLAFDLNFKSTYFLGNNPALIDLAKALFNIDIWKDTYMYRLREKDVDPLVNWHSAYTWFACDVSFFLVPFILFIIGYFFGTSWILSVTKDDFLSKIIFIITGNILLFLFANNTYLSSVFYSFMFILPVWYFTRVKILIFK